MKLRKGKTKSILESSIDASLLAVEVYNKPRTAFRSQGYITLMIIAWTRLFHAYFNQTIGDKYYYKTKGGKYEIVDGERKAWELKTCIKKYGKLSDPVTANLHFFIGLRNKIEHRSIEKNEFDTLIFGECQALLYNYENILIELFGEEYALKENLVYSLQFSRLRTKEQTQANKKALSSELRDIREYVEKYRTNLQGDVFDSQEYSIKLIQIPKISNTNRRDLAIEFVNWNELDEKDRKNYEKLYAIIKDKVITKEAINVGRFRPSQVIRKVFEKSGIQLTYYHHKYLYTLFGIRPTGDDAVDPFDTDVRYCHYDEAHNDYLYQESWVDFIVNIFQNRKLTKEFLKEAYENGDKFEIENYR